MGIDLPHVRYVVHWCMSKSVEGFYQESGRCGRDGLPAKSVLYYSKDDASKFAFLIRKASESKTADGARTGLSSGGDERSLEALRKMKDYCTKLCCRRKFLLTHFGEKTDPKELCKKTCDYCENPGRVENAMNSCNTARIVREAKKRIVPTSRHIVTSEGQWDRPHGDTYASEDDGRLDDGMSYSHNSDRLGILYNSDPTTIQSDNESSPQSGFKKAKEILLHYEALECSAGQENGFVTFKSKKSRMRDKRLNKDKSIYGDIPSKSTTTVPRPAHIMREIQQLTSQPNFTIKAGSRKLDTCKIGLPACTSDQIKAELDSLKEQKILVTARLAKLQEEGMKDDMLSSPPDHPTSLSYHRRRK